MPAERAGYTVTMFLVDVSPTMGNMRTVDVAPGPNGENRAREITNLEWSLKYVMLKVEEMIFNGRKTDQCGVILFGSDETKNIVNEENGGYDNVYEYIPVGTPSPATISKIAAIKPSKSVGDPIDALIVGIQTQSAHLGKKATWTRRMVLVTDGEHPFDAGDWESTSQKLNELNIITTIVGVDFDDPDIYTEPNKSNTKRKNEEFYAEFVTSLTHGLLGTCVLALRETSRPEPKIVKSALMTNFLRLGDTEARGDQAIEIQVKTCKAAMRARPTSMKKFAKREKDLSSADAMDWEEADEEVEALRREEYAPLDRRTEYVVEKSEEEESGKADGMDVDETDKAKEEHAKVDPDDLVKAYKYGATWVPVEEGDFEKLPSKQGIEITAFIHEEKWNREFALGEVSYIFADPNSARAQVALSSLVQGMHQRNALGVVRYVYRDSSAPKMGVIAPRVTDDKDYLVFVPMPFSEDYRKFSFPSLDKLKNKKGELVTKHHNFPTKEMMDSMDTYVDKMDLMKEGEPQESGEPLPWYNLLDSYNPAVHRIKQAIFHGAVVTDLTKDPLPPPHPELTKYFESPEDVLKKSKKALEECKKVFNVKPVVKTAGRRKKVDQDATENVGEDFSLANLMGGEAGPSAIVPDIEAKPSQNLRSGTSQTLVSSEQPSKRSPTPTPTNEADKGIAPGRIIGNVNPLKDFQENIQSGGDVVSKAVEDLSAVIVEIIRDSFSTQRYQEALECMKEFRKVALQEDEIYAWNEFLRDFKKTCRSAKFKNRDFWDHVKKEGRSLSLISEKEAETEGGISEFTEDAAIRFLRD